MPQRSHDFAAVLAGAQSRCLGHYQPTHRHQLDNQQNPIHYGKPVKEFERSLQPRSLEAEVANFLEPFDALQHDVEYWTKFLEGQ
ncbi:hypothetical protein ACKVEX_15865 [Rhodocyclaceae bacterium SMB388]